MGKMIADKFCIDICQTHTLMSAVISRNRLNSFRVIKNRKSQNIHKDGYFLKRNRLEGFVQVNAVVCIVRRVIWNSSFYRVFKNYILVRFDQKPCTIAHDFDRFWAIFDPKLIMLIFGINYIFFLFDQKPWTIAHDFDPFWAIFDPG